MNKHLVLLNIINVDLRYFFILIHNKEIEIEKIEYISDEEIMIIISNKDYEKIKDSHDFIIKSKKNLGLFYILDKIKKYKILLVSSFLGLLLLILLNNIIVDVDIIFNNKDIVNMLTYELEEHGIKKLSIKKSYQELTRIKKEILKKHKDTIEWLEIENIGMKYNIRLESRILKNNNNDSGFCNIVAKKDGMIKSIYVESGNKIKEINNYVTKGEVIISGDITFNEEIKNRVCAGGNVYAEVWYLVKVTIPIIEKEKELTNDTRYNIKLEKVSGNKKIFKSKYKYYLEEDKYLFNIFDANVYFVKEKKYEIKEKELTKEELTKNTLNIAKEKIALSLGSKEYIKEEKILFTDYENDLFKANIFVSVIEDISLKEII